MGRGRKRAGAVGTVTYGVAGNAPVTPTAASNSTTKMIDDNLNGAVWSTDIENLIEDGETVVRDAIEQDEDFRTIMTALGLNPDRSRDVAIIQALIGMFGEEEGDITTRIELSGSMNVFGNRYYMDVITMSSSADGHRRIRILPDKIQIENMQFSKGYRDVRGIGFAMLARQAWAARQIGMRTDLPVEIITSALSDEDTWVGAQVWPRMGYTFPVTGALANVAREDYGFAATNTVDLMTERSAKTGRLGIDEWDSIVKDTMKQTGNNVKIRGRMVVTDDNDPGLGVLMAYGRRTGVWGRPER